MSSSMVAVVVVFANGRWHVPVFDALGKQKKPTSVVPKSCTAQCSVPSIEQCASEKQFPQIPALPTANGVHCLVKALQTFAPPAHARNCLPVH